MIWNVISFIAGGIFGVVMMCCFVAAGDDDRRMEKLNKTDIS